ncbi:MAG: hemolysin activation/secretion protein [Chitinophagales bacterium]|jgi:hemolysin activation/secretion protein
MRILENRIPFVLCLSILTFSQLQAADLPAGATPGGVLPNLNYEITEPFVYPDATYPVDEVENVRPEDVNAPRMQVRGFRINGVMPHEKSGINLASIEQMVRTKALELVAGEASQGFTLSMFEAINVAIGRYYREKGFFLARAYIPAQKIENDIVTINIVEGYIDQILISGNRLYSDEQLDELFLPLQGEAIFLDNVENAVFIANDYPGMNATVMFGPGLEPGSAAMVVNVEEEETDGYITFDNYGSAFTGENRLRGNYQLYNLLGNADRLDLNAILTLRPQNSVYYDVAYQQPLLDNRYLVGGSYNTNQFEIGGERLADLQISGTSAILRGFMTRIISRGRSARITTTADLSLKSAESQVFDTLVSEDKLSVIGLAANYAGTSWSWPGLGVYQQMNAKLSIGLPGFLGSLDSEGNALSGRQGRVEGNAGGDFTKLNLDYLRISRLTEFQSLLLRFSGQVSSDLLTSLEQFSLGGPDTVRAYPVAEALVDNAWLFSAEWQADASPETPQTWLNKLQFSIFYDYATGKLNDPFTNVISSVALSGLGFGIQVEPFNKFTAKMQYAFVLGDEPQDNQSSPFYFRLQYDF